MIYKQRQRQHKWKIHYERGSFKFIYSAQFVICKYYKRE